MDDLLPYYERELAYLRRYSREFAERYPKTAGRLGIRGELAEDPHVERLIESVAFLNARISKKIEDDYPELTDALLEVQYPHYLRPFPACSIAQFSGGDEIDQLTKPRIVARGTEAKSHPVRGVRCTFRTAYDVALAPIRLLDARYVPGGPGPSVAAVPSSTAGVISIAFESSAPQFDLGGLQLDRVRVYLSGDQPLVASLNDALFLRTVEAYVEQGAGGRWTRLSSVPIAEVGFDEADALIDFPGHAHPAYRLLTEYFAFPDKFNFIDFDLAAMARAAGPCERITLHLAVRETGDSHAAGLLGSLSAHHLRLFCTPVINLFRKPATPVLLTQQAAAYPVVGDSHKAFAYEVYSIDSVRLVRKKEDRGEEIAELRPFFSLRHGEASQAGLYWYARRSDWVAQHSPGYETELSIVDLDFNPAEVRIDTLSLEITATNRDLPERLSIGQPSGDLFIGGAPLGQRVALLMRPTQTARFDRRNAAHWQIVSHLSLNHLSLARNGEKTLKEMLRLYDQRRTSVSALHIDGIVSLETASALERMAPTPETGNYPFPIYVPGIGIRLELDEEHFVGASLATFISVLDRFFGLYVHINNFTQLTVVSAKTGREIIRCKARSGESILV
ncbi:type VI secretion system baseplate subunit TssF [Paraburkholderia sp. NMBU_R16]|uniref:type VI secretion system baseplate subunit TssF n=1 Tax=Paraburkholderia sp. NMBU_R16 TaxID=2698676 RepID=UPI001563895F|nr:type VI secretion system baseplate subunit TssF [Paraburkholderia sp. NMBU_R16]NRO97134.1 type VI secretion system baseplate subunit TssF [Paraburkholderia sp. NMBU_R16]